MKKLMAAVAAAAALLAGCSSESPDAVPTSSEQPAPIDRPVTTATELAAALTDAGIRCVDLTPGQSTGSSTGSCEDLHLTVWPTPTGAARGVEALADLYQTTNGITGDTDFFITKDNWLIDTENRVVADATVTRFGGQIQSVS